MPQPSFGNMVPPKSFNDRVLRWLRDHDQRITELATARSGQAMQIGKGGIDIVGGALRLLDLITKAVLIVLDSTGIHVNNGGNIYINNGGAFWMRTPDDLAVVHVGQIPISDGSGRTQQVIAFGRDDGSLAFALADLGTAPGHAHQENWGWYDRTGSVVLAEDTISGQGLAWPLLPFGPFMSNTVPTDTTTSGSFATLQTLIGYKQQPKVFMQILVRSDDGATTGEVRVIDQSGNVVGGVQTITGSQYSYVNIGPVPLLGTHGQSISLNIQARRTAGTGSIGVRGIGAIGQPS